MWSTIAAVVGAVASALLAMNLIESRSARAGLAEQKLESIQRCLNDQEARLRILEAAYAGQAPVIQALGRKMGIELPTS